MERVTMPAGGRFGICVIHAKSGTRVSVNGLDSFPAASTFKIGLAAQIFSLVDKGELDLAQMIELLDADRVFYGPIYDHLIHPGVSLSLLNWLELMLKLSDNSATDVLLRLVGGPTVLTEWVGRHVGPGFLVAKSTAEEIRLVYRLPPSSRWASLSDEMRDRLAAKLPRDTEVAHKTGLDIGSVNDVGAIRLPGDRGELILAVLNKGQVKSNAISLEAISDVARAAFDYFALFD
jgi:beta-lactamase class A